MSLLNKIYEHLKTKGKYNKLELRCDVLRDMYDKKVVELETERKIFNKRREVWEEKLKEQEEEIIRLRKRKTAKENK